MARASRVDAEANVARNLRQVIAKVILFNHDVAEKLGLGASDGQFMTLLQLHGPLTPGELARYSGLTTGTVTAVLDRLERGGFAHRRPHPTDRRKIIVSLDDELVERDTGPLYASQRQLLEGALKRYTIDQLAIIGDFLAVLGADEPGRPAG